MKTKVIHSLTKQAWNVIGTELGGKYKIARIPYELCQNEILDNRFKHDALETAFFISKCLNNKDKIKI